MQKAIERMIEKWQIRKIHALKNRLQITDEQYRKVIHVNFSPAQSSKELNYWQAEFLINNLEVIAIENGVWEKLQINPAYEDMGRREGMATPAQLRKIEAMWKGLSQISSETHRKSALRKWLFTYFKVSDLRFCDSATTSKVISALGQMQMRKYKKTRRIDSEACFHDRAARV